MAKKRKVKVLDIPDAEEVKRLLESRGFRITFDEWVEEEEDEVKFRVRELGAVKEANGMTLSVKVNPDGAELSASPGSFFRYCEASRLGEELKRFEEMVLNEKRRATSAREVIERELKEARRFISTMRDPYVDYSKHYVGGFLRLFKGANGPKYVIQLQIDVEELNDAIDIVKAIDDILTSRGIKVNEEIYEHYR